MKAIPKLNLIAAAPVCAVAAGGLASQELAQENRFDKGKFDMGWDALRDQIFLTKST